MKKNIYYKDLNTIRLLSCIAVLFYHLGLLKGGFLAVCTFFVITGYLSVTNAFKEKNFSIKKYYKSRFKRIYLPLLITVLSTVAIFNMLNNISWITLKSETLSALFGYNNFWQIEANLDYFARHIDSPFMHFWYIAILLQFELLFPFIFLALKKLGNKSKKIPCIITLILSILSIVYFLYSLKYTNITNAYYNTFSRSFSIFLGLFLGFYKSYYNFITLNIIKKNNLNKYIYYIYLTILILSFFFLTSTSSYFALSMLVITFISMRLIDYATIDKTSLLTKKDNILKKLTNISYEIYLIQYPVIYLFQYININYYLKLFFIIIIIFILAYILYISLNNKIKQTKLRYLSIIFIILISLLGTYKLISASSMEKEMATLKKELKENELLMIQKQKEYQLLKQKEEASWLLKLKELENTNNYEEMTKKLPITFIGDSVMLGAMNNIKELFYNSYFDAKESRPISKAIPIIEDLKEKNILGNPVVIHLGTNGECYNNCKENILNLLKDKEVFWINTTNNKTVNENLNSLKKNYSNLHIIDWYSQSNGHTDWFYKDKIHLPLKGKIEYTNIIYKEILKVYKEKFKLEKENLIKNHLDELKNKTTFYGDDIILYNFEEFENNFKDGKFIIKKQYNSDDLIKTIKESIKDNTISYKIVLAFQDSNISTNDYKEIINLCKDSNIYIIATTKELDKSLKEKNVKIINFYTKLNKNTNYLLPDKIHLSKDGNNALIKLITKELN